LSRNSFSSFSADRLSKELRSWFLFSDRRRELRAAARRFRAAFLADKTKKPGTLSRHLAYLLDFVRQARVLSRLSYLTDANVTRRQHLVEVYQLDAPYYWIYDRDVEDESQQLVRVAGWKTLILSPMIFSPYEAQPKLIAQIEQFRSEDAHRQIDRFVQDFDKKR